MAGKRVANTKALWHVVALAEQGSVRGLVRDGQADHDCRLIGERDHTVRGGLDADTGIVGQALGIVEATSDCVPLTDVPIIAFQGGRVHLLAYRPIDDNSKIARTAVLLSRAITAMTRSAFNPLFEEELRLSAKAAADLGETVATRGGTKGDSELLFLGNAANRPAKLLGTSVLTVTTRLEKALDDQLDYDTEKCGEEDAVLLKISRENLEAAIAEDDIDWSVKKSAAKLADELEKWPAERFQVSGASTLISPADLSRSNSKLVDAAVILMDIDGFSDYVEEAENDEIKRDAILTLDAIRQEMRDVLKVDFSGVRIQYQGDNMIGLVHLPAGDEEKIAIAVAEVAAGMQGSMSITLPKVVPDAKRLDVSVGVSMSNTVVACLGEYAKRNSLVLGPAATEAERIQTRLPGKQTGIDKTTYEALPDDIQELYVWSTNAKAYVAVDLSASKLARVREALSREQEQAVAPAEKLGRFAIGAATAAVGAAKHVRPYRPYAH